MRLNHLVMIIILCILPFRAEAEVNCSVFDAIERIQFAEMRLASAGDNRFASRDAALLVSEVARLDGDQIKSAHGGKLSTFEVATLESYMTYAQQLALILVKRDVNMVENYFARPSFAPQQEVVGRILPRLRCNQQTSEGTSNGTQRVTSSIKQDQGARKITFTGSATVLAAIVLFLAVGFRVYAFGVAWRNRKKRRSKRFHCYIETQINYGHMTKRAVILDISCNGAKIQIDVEDNEHTVEVLIINTWYKAKVSWHNPHYLGVRFHTPLRSAFVETLCSPQNRQ